MFALAKLYAATNLLRGKREGLGKLAPNITQSAVVGRCHGNKGNSVTAFDLEKHFTNSTLVHSKELANQRLHRTIL
jgi:hypothetical protein